MESNNKKRKKNSKKYIIYTIVLILLGVIISGVIRSRSSNNFRETTVSISDIFRYHTYGGVVKSKNRETVIAEKPMQIKSINIKEGDQVDAGTLLFVTSQDEEILSGIKGEVSRIYPEINSQVLGGSKLADIVDYDDLEIGIRIDEYDLKTVEKDQEAVIRIDSIGKEIKGTITRISREAVNVSGVAYFDASIDLEYDADIRVGMNTEAVIEVERAESVPIIPIDFIQFTQSNEPYVLVKTDKRLPEKRDITVGINDGMNAQVTQGLDGSETILAADIQSTEAARPFRGFR